ncbi:hypothetical protein KM043_010073 [Ampulex compressa]|nr:hypothetical protein KM043_010073 [Ampulex compressa]
MALDPNKDYLTNCPLLKAKTLPKQRSPYKWPSIQTKITSQIALYSRLRLYQNKDRFTNRSRSKQRSLHKSSTTQNEAPDKITIPSQIHLHPRSGPPKYSWRTNRGRIDGSKMRSWIFGWDRQSAAVSAALVARKSFALRNTSPGKSRMDIARSDLCERRETAYCGGGNAYGGSPICRPHSRLHVQGRATSTSAAALWPWAPGTPGAPRY